MIAVATSTMIVVLGARWRAPCRRSHRRPSRRRRRPSIRDSARASCARAPCRSTAARCTGRCSAEGASATCSTAVWVRDSDCVIARTGRRGVRARVRIARLQGEGPGARLRRRRRSRCKSSSRRSTTIISSNIRGRTPRYWVIGAGLAQSRQMDFNEEREFPGDGGVFKVGGGFEYWLNRTLSAELRSALLRRVFAG